MHTFPRHSGSWLQGSGRDFFRVQGRCLKRSGIPAAAVIGMACLVASNAHAGVDARLSIDGTPIISTSASDFGAIGLQGNLVGNDFAVATGRGIAAVGSVSSSSEAMTAELSYTFDVSGAGAGATVLIDWRGLAFANAGLFGVGYIELIADQEFTTAPTTDLLMQCYGGLSSPFNNNLAAPEFLHVSSGPQTLLSACGASKIDGVLDLVADANGNATGRFYLKAHSYGLVTSGVGFDYTGSAYLDPMISLDPSTSGGVTLTLPTGIGNNVASAVPNLSPVPEPATWLSSGCGLLLILATLKRRAGCSGGS